MARNPLWPDQKNADLANKGIAAENAQMLDKNAKLVAREKQIGLDYCPPQTPAGQLEE